MLNCQSEASGLEGFECISSQRKSSSQMLSCAVVSTDRPSMYQCGAGGGGGKSCRISHGDVFVFRQYRSCDLWGCVRRKKHQSILGISLVRLRGTGTKIPRGYGHRRSWLELMTVPNYTTLCPSHILSLFRGADRMILSTRRRSCTGSAHRHLHPGTLTYFGSFRG